MRRSRKVLVLVLVVGISLFGYVQYAAATQIGVIVTESKLVNEDENGSTYNVQLEFENSSFLMLNAGETDFEISVDYKKVADGVLEPFVLPAMSKVVVDGSYQTEKKSNQAENEETGFVVISGITKYDVFFTSINVPFIYFPPEDQARELIHQD